MSLQVRIFPQTRVDLVKPKATQSVNMPKQTVITLAPVGVKGEKGDPGSGGSSQGAPVGLILALS